DVPGEAETGNPSPVALQIPSHAKARTPLRVSDNLRAALILRAVEVHAGTEVERQPRAVAPGIVDVRRVGADIVADALLEDRRPVDEGRVVVLENRIDRRAVDDRGRRRHVVLACRLAVGVL